MSTFKSFRAATTVKDIRNFFVFTVDSRLYRTQIKVKLSVLDACVELHEACSWYSGPISAVSASLSKRVRYIPSLHAIVYLGAFKVPSQNATFNEFNSTTGTKLETFRKNLIKLCKHIGFAIYTFSPVVVSCNYSDVIVCIAYSTSGEVFFANFHRPGSDRSVCELLVKACIVSGSDWQRKMRSRLKYISEINALVFFGAKPRLHSMFVHQNKIIYYGLVDALRHRVSWMHNYMRLQIGVVGAVGTVLAGAAIARAVIGKDVFRNLVKFFKTLTDEERQRVEILLGSRDDQISVDIEDKRNVNLEEQKDVRAPTDHPKPEQTPAHTQEPTANQTQVHDYNIKNPDLNIKKGAPLLRR